MEEAASKQEEIADWKRLPASKRKSPIGRDSQQARGNRRLEETARKQEEIADWKRLPASTRKSPIGRDCQGDREGRPYNTRLHVKQAT
ncbi:MAG: hypothetical protein E6I93_06240 [Chloroflexi bacterium]|nr:MAG: hypothetical protein E6I93_06240 [Chloroflexota bacterium]